MLKRHVFKSKLSLGMYLEETQRFSGNCVE